MALNGIQPVGTQPMSKGKKAAIATGAVVGAAAVAATAVAFTKGKTADTKGLKAIGEAIITGYKKMGGEIAKKATEAWTFVTEKFGKAKDAVVNFFNEKIAPKFQKATETAEKVAEEVAQ